MLTSESRQHKLTTRLLRGQGSEQLALTSAAQPRTSRPVQALLAFPGQHVDEQLAARAVAQSRGSRGRAAAGA